MARYPSGTILFEKYRIEKSIGTGGFAEVYLATHLHLNAPRALKVLTREGEVTTGVLGKVAQRFRLEAQLGARFAQEPHVVRVFDFEWDPDQGLLVLVMEYLPGGSLKDRLRQAREQGMKGLSVEDVTRTAYHAALGLAALHQIELVHRDVKPSNILYDTEGRAKIADLGVAQVPHGLTQRTEMGSTAPQHPGTPEYMSPEQENTVGYLRPASDIYSLGVTLFEALTLRKYKNLRPGTRLTQLRPDVPSWLDDIIARMLSESYKSRPWDGSELARLLAPYVGEETLGASPLPQGAVGDESTVDTWQEGDTPLFVEENLSTPTSPRFSHSSGDSGTFTPTQSTAGHFQTATVSSDRESKQQSKRWWLWGAVGGILLLLALAGIVFMGRGGSEGASLASESKVVLTGTPHADQASTISTPSQQSSADTFVTPAAGKTSSPTPTIEPVLMRTPVPLNVLVPITVGNATRIQPVARWDIGNPITGVAISPDGMSIAAWFYGEERDKYWSKAVLLYTSDGVRANTLDVSRYSADNLRCCVSWTRGSFSPDGTLLAVGTCFRSKGACKWGGVLIWRTMDGSLAKRLEGHTEGVTSVAFSPDGTLLASGSRDHTVRIWSTSTWERIYTLKGHEGRISSVAFSPDGKLLASGSLDGTVRLWRVRDGTLVRTLEGHINWVNSVAFSPDGKLLASGSQDRTVRLWRVSDGALIYTLKGHKRTIWSVAFSSDGTLLASASFDKTVRLWRVEDGSLVYTLKGHMGPVTSVAFSPDGTLLVSGAHDGTVRLWGVRP